MLTAPWARISVRRGPIFAAAGAGFPDEQRRAGFACGTTLFVATVPSTVIGYIEFGPDRDAPDTIYLASIQIAPAHRRGALLRRLLAHAIVALRRTPFAQLRSGVQTTNGPAISLYRRLGFALAPNSRAATSLMVSGDRALLDSPLARRLAPSG